MIRKYSNEAETVHSSQAFYREYIVPKKGNINYVLAAIVISGGLQVILGFFKMGRYAKMLPSSVLNGILAAIGIIIFSKQIHFALGTKSNATTIIETLLDAFLMLPETRDPSPDEPEAPPPSRAFSRAVFPRAASFSALMAASTWAMDAMALVS